MRTPTNNESGPPLDTTGQALEALRVAQLETNALFRTFISLQMPQAARAAPLATTPAKKEKLLIKEASKNTQMIATAITTKNNGENDIIKENGRNSGVW